MQNVNNTYETKTQYNPPLQSVSSVSILVHLCLLSQLYLHQPLWFGEKGGKKVKYGVEVKKNNNKINSEL